jgi:hypothetical protein
MHIPETFTMIGSKVLAENISIKPIKFNITSKIDHIHSGPTPQIISFMPDYLLSNIASITNAEFYFSQIDIH